ncbi:MAG: SAM-dependent methyltransferase [Rhodobacterales bacterium]|nr:MAG: SAM-dependent methyltransferase [Rhodobacterales bacterium]
MTPGARFQAAIECLDAILAGAPAEKVLTGWARRSRFAGSKDRAAVRDHVYDVLRQRNSLAALSGQPGGRGLVLGLVMSQGVNPGTIFNGEGHAPPVLEPEELEPQETGTGYPGQALNLPDWLIPVLKRSLGDSFQDTHAALGRRAPVYLRVNGMKSTVEQAAALLRKGGIETRPTTTSELALEVTMGARRLSQSDAYQSGLVELQDLSSQSAMEAVPLSPGDRVLDYCAGGGGKSLALAARVKAKFFAHDIAPRRMNDLSARAKRAGSHITQLDPAEVARHAPYDTVLCDVPCSGSGTWRRDPDAKWRFDRAALDRLLAVQAEILDDTQALVAEGGQLIYTTCSLIDEENEWQIDRFCQRNPAWSVKEAKGWLPSGGGDGFFFARLTRN